MAQEQCGQFVISLDFELYWGMRDVISVKAYENNLKGTPIAIQEMLKQFQDYDIHTTWATIGFLFCKDVADLEKHTPVSLPQYHDEAINLYQYAQKTPDLHIPYHFAPQLIDLILSYPNQEMATHTFSHYYCLEKGQNEKDFYADLMAHKRIAEEKDISLKSLVFPRNQYNKNYLNIIQEVGITSYRGNEKGWFYDAASEEEKKTPLKRLLRMVDSYINISGYHTYKLQDIAQQKPYNIPASRFLRPYSAKLSFLDKFRLKRIKDAMTYAAKNGELFHLWWHPHNFGANTKENIAFLKEVLQHYQHLNKQHNFKSLTMSEVSEMLR
ncbi:MAG: hypothetical protein K0U47_05750 [Epsilonproteobacteria bacterium]|nr:hypothetical protein [Campylobacterota bacterium]